MTASPSEIIFILHVMRTNKSQLQTFDKIEIIWHEDQYKKNQNDGK